MAEDPEFETAEDVANHLLEETGRGLIDNDVDAFVARFNLPLVIGTFEGHQVLKTTKELRDTLSRVQEFIRQNNIDMVVRHNISAQFITPDEVSTTHESRYLSKGQQVGEPMLCHGTIKRVNGFWKIFDNEYAVQDAPMLDRALLGQTDNDTTGLGPLPGQKPVLRVSRQDLTQGSKT